MTIKEALNIGKNKLIENNIEEASLVSRMLLSSVTDLRKEELIINSEKELDDDELSRFLNRNRKNIKWISYSISN